MVDDLARFLIARYGDVAGDLRGRAADDPAPLWARLVADCGSKRRVVLQHGRVDIGGRLQPLVCISCGPTASWPCLTLRLLALPYVGHPDYRRGWAP